MTTLLEHLKYLDKIQAIPNAFIAEGLRFEMDVRHVPELNQRQIYHLELGYYLKHYVNKFYHAGTPLAFKYKLMLFARVRHNPSGFIVIANLEDAVANYLKCIRDAYAISDKPKDVESRYTRLAMFLKKNQGIVQ
jgi:hypothetical protein